MKMSVNWILSNITQDADGVCETNHLYESYKFAWAEADVTETVLSKNLFIDYVKSLFPDMKKGRRRCNGSHQTVYQGISLKQDNVIPTQPLTFSEIQNCITNSMELKTFSSNIIQIQQDSGCSCNGNTVFKVLHFYEHGKFDITISGKTIDLKKLNIQPAFELNKNSVMTVFAIFNAIKLCNGLPYKKSSVITRFHTLDAWTCDEDTYRSLRSLSCLKAVPINSQSSTCRVCQQQFFQENKENIDENNNSETTEGTIQRIFPGAPPKMITLLAEQAKNVGRDPKGRRWSKDFIATCLQLYNRSPKCYELLKKSEILILPSPSVLILYKNSLKQEPGFDNSIFQWMHEEAERMGMSEGARIGGIIFDEMSIQQDIQIEKKGSTLELAGFTELGQEGDLCQNLKKGTRNKTMGTHILQLLFLGLNGFRFPFAHFVTDSIQSSQLYGLFFRAVYLLQEFGFQVLYTCMDGAQGNRNFLHICLGQKPTRYLTTSPFSSHPIIFIMDISHVLKKIRNNTLKSGLHAKCTRLLTLPNSLEIHWQMFVDYFEWDQQNALQLHRKLTREHIYPDNQLKMRNYLAFDMLDSTMLNSILRYKESLGEKGQVLDGLIQFLQQTSTLVKIFQDQKPVRDITDSRLQELRSVDLWFTNWEENTPQKDKRKLLMSSQCHEDIHSSIQGFIHLCETVHEMKSNVFVTPSLVNSDVIENVFNQQRSTYNGANTNPSALQYRKTINSILIGENSISKKANASRSVPAQPFTVAVKPPTKRKRPSYHTDVDSTIKVIRM